MCTVKEIQEAIREDCRSQHDMDSTDIDRVMQTLPFAQEEPFTGARPQKPLFWFYERDRKGSIQTTQEVEIYFNFVGRFVPPAFGEVELTPEELEEIRKREERKDRLHQNYLKRKASGAQKRYEDKIKGRKKAEIEAKKAAIRAEDIAKGVFVPVSSLPQREPMKGVQTA